MFCSTYVLMRSSPLSNLVLSYISILFRVSTGLSTSSGSILLVKLTGLGIHLAFAANVGFPQAASFIIFFSALSVHALFSTGCRLVMSQTTSLLRLDLWTCGALGVGVGYQNVHRIITTNLIYLYYIPVAKKWWMGYEKNLDKQDKYYITVIH